MHPGLVELDELIAEVRRLVQRIQDGIERSPGVLLEPCQERFRALVESVRSHGEPGGAERDAWAERLEEAARLNAVAVSLVERQRSELVERARRTRDVRQRMSGMRARHRDAGRSCDVSC